jgi:hypothetical protein
MDEGDGHAALADGRRDALDWAESYIAAGEDAGNTGQGLVSRTVRPYEPPLSALRILSPSIVWNCGLINAISGVLMDISSH